MLFFICYKNLSVCGTNWVVTEMFVGEKNFLKRWMCRRWLLSRPRQRLALFDSLKRPFETSVTDQGDILIWLFTLWFQLEGTVLLIGTLLLFDPVLFPKYEAWLLIGSIPNFEALLGQPFFRHFEKNSRTKKLKTQEKNSITQGKNSRFGQALKILSL